MKKAYELALERLNRESGPPKKLSDAQKEQLAEIDRVFDAKIAEKRLEYEARIAVANYEETERLQRELAEELSNLEAERERRKDAIWNAASS
ncbi:MAG TPA: hypothetical protein PKY35_06490 [Candidatus Hydrogenedentes bacterium]|nr:hypothetical protein [Candidatus Hydrogenedentota bacterium]HOL76662.1 hypothetical protein [Candidatus Hydrogenedentota bacterium]HPO84495.1 hypothetical protein [Candidatus Hydrogenedentota bacterium]